MSDKLRFGVVGLGMGVHHCRAIKKARGATLAAVCDRAPERLDAQAAAFGVKGYASYAAMLRDPSIDVVSIATESAYHARMGIAAARAGKHIVMEKPVNITPARITRLKKAVAVASVKCGCIFQARMGACNRALQRAIASGAMGRIIGLHGALPWYRGADYYAGPFGAWRGTWSVDGGGSLMNQGIHTVDLMIYFAGPVKRVCGFYGVFDHDIEAEDNVVACLEFESGALGALFTTTCARPEGAQSIYGLGTKGSFRKQGDVLLACDMGSPAERRRILKRFGAGNLNDDAGKDPLAVAYAGHTTIMEDMVQAVRQDREPVIPLAQARHAVEVVCAVYKAANTGKTVVLR